MRILHLLASPYWSGPMENVALLALAQRELGHEVAIAIDRLRSDAHAEEIAAPHLKALNLLDEELSLSVKAPFWRHWGEARALSKRSVDVVHSHFTHDHYVARLGRPHRARVIRSIHAPRSLRWSLPDADAYTVPSEDLARRLLGHRIGVLSPLVGPQFVPPASREMQQRALDLAGTPVVGMVSTFQASRRHDLGVSAFAQLRRSIPTAHLVFVGDGEREQSIREQVAAAGLNGAVTFAGYQRGDDFVRWLQALDVVWILGLGNDWSGRAAAQARACGVRVVAVDEGGLFNLADDVVPLDPDAIASATQGGTIVPRAVASNADIARRVLALYE